MLRTLTRGLLPALLATACSSPTGSNGTGLPLGAGSVQLDVGYCESGPLQKLDLYFPKNRVRAPTPVVLHIHGGGWTRGDKASGPWFFKVGEALIARGYVVASANYRLAPTPWPAEIEDVACAIRHLKENAGAYGIDPARIGIWGNSAGGHLAALIGTTDDFSGPGASTRPQAVVAMYGIHDLTAGDTPLVTAIAIQQAFGSPPDPDSEVLVEASPVTHPTGGDAPMPLIHGAEDLVVLPNQSQALFDRLTDAGAAPQLLLVANAGHELEPSGGALDPTEGEITARITAFLDARLLGP